MCFGDTKEKACMGLLSIPSPQGPVDFRENFGDTGRGEKTVVWPFFFPLNDPVPWLFVKSLLVHESLFLSFRLLDGLSFASNRFCFFRCDGSKHHALATK